MKKLILVLLIVPVFVLSQSICQESLFTSNPGITGTVQIVESGEDYKVKIDNYSICELKIGEGLLSDVKIKIVEFGEDFSAKISSYENPVGRLGRQMFREIEEENRKPKPDPYKQMSDSFNEGLAEGAQISAAIQLIKIKKNQKVLDENIPIYEIEPSIELAFKIAKAAGALRELGKYDDRYGPILKEHKLLVVKYKGSHKKYRKAVKKGKEK